MFGIAWSELLLIGVVALVVIPPKDLPTAMRMVGKWVGQMRRMAFDFQHQMSSALREAEFDDLKKSVNDLTSFDAMGDIRKELESATQPLTMLEGQMREDLSIPATLDHSFGSDPTIAAPASTTAELSTEAESSTPPGHTGFPGAMDLSPTPATSEEQTPIASAEEPAHAAAPVSGASA